MLKPYDELRKIDITPYCDERDDKFLYLNWAKCIDLLHQNGAETAYFEPIINEKGSSLFMTDQVFTDKNGVTNRCYEIGVKVFVDDKSWEFRSPLMNGGNPVKDNSISQQRIWNAQCRAFVKSVAIHTGLGFDLWLKNEESEEKSSWEDDLNKHNIYKIQERVEQKATRKMKEKNITKAELAKALNLLDEDELNNYFRSFKVIDRLEKAIDNI